LANEVGGYQFILAFKFCILAASATVDIEMTVTWSQIKAVITEELIIII